MVNNSFTSYCPSNNPHNQKFHEPETAQPPPPQKNNNPSSVLISIHQSFAEGCAWIAQPSAKGCALCWGLFQSGKSEQSRRRTNRSSFAVYPAKHAWRLIFLVISLLDATRKGNDRRKTASATIALGIRRLAFNIYSAAKFQNPKARFRRYTSHEPNRIQWIKFVWSTASESIRNGSAGKNGCGPALIQAPIFTWAEPNT